MFTTRSGENVCKNFLSSIIAAFKIEKHQEAI